MTIRHHLDDATLLAYASGNLGEAFSLMAATHVSLCDACRATVESFDAVGGSLIDATSGVEMSDDSLQRILARIDRPSEQDAGAAERCAVTSGALPTPLQSYVGGDLESVRWRPIGMGVRQAILPTSPGATARLLCIPAGAAMPNHSHHGRELTMVLTGAFNDADAHFARGDVEFADDQVQHHPTADIGEDCICLVVTDAPLRFNGLLHRIVQKFVGI